MGTTCDHSTDDLADLVDGDRAAIDRHSDHLATCDVCRDARHDAKRITELVGGAGADYVVPADLAERVLAAIPAAASSAQRPVVPQPQTQPPVVTRERVETPFRRPRKRVWIAVGAAAAPPSGVGIHALRGGSGPGAQSDEPSERSPISSARRRIKATASR
jgi:hypothetical protein